MSLRVKRVMKAPNSLELNFELLKIKKRDVFCNIYIPHVFKEVNCKFIQYRFRFFFFAVTIKEREKNLLCAASFSVLSSMLFFSLLSQASHLPSGVCC